MSETLPFTPADLAALRDFLDGVEASESKLDLSQCHGLFASLCAGPVVVLPSVFLPLVFGGAPPLFGSEARKLEINRLLFDFFRFTDAQVKNHAENFDPLLLESGEAGGRSWAHGFYMGMNLAWSDWQPLLRDAAMKEWTWPILALGSPKGWEELDALPAEKRPSVTEGLVARIGEAVPRIDHFWTPLRAAHAKSEGGRKIVSSEPKASVATGRNDLCPCGSGKKFKHCHGAPRSGA